MTDKQSPVGLYLHIPFCEKKCAYCDFYSSFLNEELLDKYTASLIENIKEWGGKLNRPINTIYLGGGTPSLLESRIIPLLKAVNESFRVYDNAEITLEVNPSKNIEDVLISAKKAGVNRISIGAQSGDDDELKVLGRTHTADDTVKAVKLAKSYGIDNISLDIMLGLPGSTIKSLEKSLDFICDLSPDHISAYILKIEENTAFNNKRDTLSLPDEDEQAEQYLFMCEYLEKRGYIHYEISNFCRPGMQSRHNLKYWNSEEYLGIGPTAHSFISGKRFYYPRDIKAFMNGTAPIPDGEGGGIEEYIMLKLRLSDGLNFSEFKERFDRDLPKTLLDKCRLFDKHGLINLSDNTFSLTDKGMIVSNSVISELLECIE